MPGMSRPFSLLLTFLLACEVAGGVDEQSQSALNQRAVRELEQANAELSATFQRQLASAEKSPAVRDALLASEKAWLVFREADAQYESRLGDGGSARDYYVHKRMIYLTKQRIYQLQTPFAQGWRDADH
jgi:uncharacterized protein YecT (DUF1311 family)